MKCFWSPYLCILTSAGISDPTLWTFFLKKVCICLVYFSHRRGSFLFNVFTCTGPFSIKKVIFFFKLAITNWKLALLYNDFLLWCENIPRIYWQTQMLEPSAFKAKVKRICLACLTVITRKLRNRKTTFGIKLQH